MILVFENHDTDNEVLNGELPKPFAIIEPVDEDGMSCELTSPNFLADEIGHDIRIFGKRHEYVRIGLIDEDVATEKHESYKQEIERNRENDERRQYEKLKAKYDPPTPPEPRPTIKVKPGFRRAAFKTQPKR